MNGVARDAGECTPTRIMSDDDGYDRGNAATLPDDFDMGSRGR